MKKFLPYIFRIGTLIASRAENADFFFLNLHLTQVQVSAEISVFQRPDQKGFVR